MMWPGWCATPFNRGWSPSTRSRAAHLSGPPTAIELFLCRLGKLLRSFVPDFVFSSRPPGCMVYLRNRHAPVRILIADSHAAFLKSAADWLDLVPSLEVVGRTRSGAATLILAR